MSRGNERTSVVVGGAIAAVANLAKLNDASVALKRHFGPVQNVPVVRQHRWVV